MQCNAFLRPNHFLRFSFVTSDLITSITYSVNNVVRLDAIASNKYKNMLENMFAGKHLSESDNTIIQRFSSEIKINSTFSAFLLSLERNKSTETVPSQK